MLVCSCPAMARLLVSRPAALLAAGVLLLASTGSAEVTITDNGYSGVLVGISKDVPQDDGPQLIEAIKVGRWVMGSRENGSRPASRMTLINTSDSNDNLLAARKTRK